MRQPMIQLTPAEFQEWTQSDHPFTLVDVREDWERDAFNIGGLHIPLGDLIGRKNELPTEKDIVLYCEKGIRSQIAAQRLEGFGFARLFNLVGGMKGWRS